MPKDYVKTKDVSVQKPFWLPQTDQRGISQGYMLETDFNDASRYVDSNVEDFNTFGRFPFSRIIEGGTYLFGSGSLGAPAIAPLVDSDTGIYWPAVGTMGFQVNGTLEVSVNSSGLAIADMTQGSVLFAGASGQISQNNSSFFWDNTNARLGIGTASPARQLHLTGSASMRAEMQFTNAAASPKSWHLSCNGSSFTDASADFAITETSVATQFKIKAGGEVDITAFANVGTCTDANTQGDIAVGLTGAARIFYDQSAAQFKMFASGGSNNVAFNVTSGGILDLTASGNITEFVNGTTAQAIRVYGTTTSSRYVSITAFTGGSSQIDNSTASSLLLLGTNAIAVSPGTDAAVALGGSSSRWSTLSMSAGVNIYNASGDANAITQLSTSGFAFGAGGASSLDAFILRDGAAGTVGLRNGANAMVFRVYNTFTSSTNKEFGKLEWSGSVFRVGTEKGSGGGTARNMDFQTDATSAFTIDTNQILFPAGTLATNMTKFFINIPGAAGAPSGTPATTTGFPMYYDSTNNVLYIYNGGWKGVALA